ncbi:MAG: DUF1002 domain-containing protein [Clostridia bacterium]|nr:DUF1002 domain-containing protein [Clostridia bacterium]
MLRKIVVTVLAACLLTGALCTTAMADNGSRVTIGADNSDDAVDTVYGYFRIDRGDVEELEVTNAQERALLGDLVPDTQIGDVALSCAYVETRSSGGIELESYNIKYVTDEMYKSALQTAGIKDAKVIVAAAKPVSGTGALAGIYKAYEDMTGQKLDEEAKSVAAEELVITGDLQEAIGSVSSDIMQDLKEKLKETKGMSDSEIRDTIRETAAEYNAELSDGWVEQILGLIKKMNELNIDPDTFLQLAKTGEGMQGFLAGVGDFFKGVGDFITGLFGHSAN